jgi:hypothetical protein
MIPINIRTNSLKGVRWHEGFKRIKQFLQILCLLVILGGLCAIVFSKELEGIGDIKPAAYFFVVAAITLEVFIEISFRVLVWIIGGFLPKEKVAD